MPAPGAPAELTSDEDRPGQSPDGITDASPDHATPAVTVTSDPAADDVPVVEDADAATPKPAPPEGGDTAREAPVPPAEAGDDKVAAMRVTTSPTGATVPVSAGKMSAAAAAGAASPADATTPDQPVTPAPVDDAPAAAPSSAESTDAPSLDVGAEPSETTADEPASEAPADAPAAEAPAVPEPDPVVIDEARQPLVDLLAERLGEDFVASHVEPGHDITIRVTRDAWVRTAEICRDELGLVYFSFLSAMDWMASPFGRSEDGGLAGAGDDPAVATADPTSFDPGTTGGETRFQMLARLQAITAPTLGITIKCDVPATDLTMPTWTKVFPGADWHERECAEMFGIDFAGHPHLVKLYLPGAFEGFPLRKDFPLLARDVKPWPGLVDVEAMPGEDPEADDEGATVTAGAEEA